jgi:predicted P-loop ATPase/GTPase
VGTVFVFGMLESSPGKTTVASALLRGLNNQGLDMAPMKPRSGHNYWYQHDSFMKCKREGRLYCEDIIKLKSASGCRLPYEILNPIDALLSPLSYNRFLETDRVEEFYHWYGYDAGKLLLERYTFAHGDSHHSEFCFNGFSIEHLFLDRNYVEEVTEGKKVYRLNSLEDWTGFYNKNAENSVSSCLKTIREKHEHLLVESFSDEIFKIPGLDYDVAIGVAPGVAVLYPPERLEQAINIKTRKLPLKTVQASSILSLINPRETVKINPIVKKDLNDYDTLSHKLNELIEAVSNILEATRSGQPSRS